MGYILPPYIPHPDVFNKSFFFSGSCVDYERKPWEEGAIFRLDQIIYVGWALQLCSCRLLSGPCSLVWTHTGLRTVKQVAAVLLARDDSMFFFPRLNGSPYLVLYVVSIDGNDPFIGWQIERGLDRTISSVVGESYRVNVSRTSQFLCHLLVVKCVFFKHFFPHIRLILVNCWRAGKQITCT